MLRDALGLGGGRRAGWGKWLGLDAALDVGNQSLPPGAERGSICRVRHVVVVKGLEIGPSVLSRKKYEEPPLLSPGAVILGVI